MLLVRFLSGDTLEEAMEMAIDCLAGYLYTCQIEGESIPKPSKISDINPEAIAKELDSEFSFRDF